MLNGKSAVTISGQGTVKTEYDYAVFVVNAKAQGDAGSKARERVEKRVASLGTLVKTLKDRGLIHEVVSTFDITPHTHYDQDRREHLDAGYLASYELRFTSKNMDNVSAIHNELLDEEGSIAVASPMFRISEKNYKLAEDKALILAWKDVKQTLTKQCKILEIDEEDLELSSWSLNNRNHGARPLMAKAVLAESTMDDGKIEVQAGKMVVKVDLNINYVWYICPLEF